MAEEDCYRIFLQKFTIIQFNKERIFIHGTRKFITVFTKRSTATDNHFYAVYNQLSISVHSVHGPHSLQWMLKIFRRFLNNAHRMKDLWRHSCPSVRPRISFPKTIQETSMKYYRHFVIKVGLISFWVLLLHCNSYFTWSKTQTLRKCSKNDSPCNT